MNLRHALFGALMPVLIACAGIDPVGDAPSVVRWDAEAYAGGDFFALPWPAAQRIKADGRIDLTNLPGRDQHYILQVFLPLLEDRLVGFSPNGAIYFYASGRGFVGAPLPDTAATMTTDSAVQLLNIDPDSPRYGERIPLEATILAERGMFQPAGTLALLPLAGFPMALGARYAAIVAPRDARGWPAAASAVQAQLETAAPGSDWGLLRTALDAMGIPRARVLAATVFRTGNPTAAVQKAYDVVQSLPAPTLRNLAADTYPTRCPTFATTTYTLIQGELDLPQFLRGEPPYLHVGAGDLVTDHTGAPVLQRYEHGVVTLALPDGAPMGSGYPLVIYQHGAGGNRHSFVRDGTACALTARGLAGAAIDFPLHGDRNPAPHIDPDLLLVNPENLPAVIDVERQAAIDLFTLRRALAALDAPAGTAGFPRAIRFRRDRVAYIGHSQGSFVGVPFLAFEQGVSAAVLSGSGAHMISFITERIGGQTIDAERFLNIQDAEALGDALAVAFGVPGETMDRFHPLLTLIQHIVDPIDPVNYARFVIRDTDNPKHIWQSAGFLDSFDPPGVNQNLAVALGLDIAEPLALRYARLELAGGRVLPTPISGNLELRGHLITAVNSQFPQGDHWVYLEDGIARAQGTSFLETFFRDGVPTVPSRCSWSAGALVCP